MEKTEIIKCPHCGKCWHNTSYDGFICHCFDCDEMYYRDENRIKTLDWIAQAFFRVKG